MTNFYPINLNIDYKKVVIVGGGRVAAQKVHTLRDTKAEIIVVSPELHETLQPLVVEQIFTWRAKRFEPKDVDDAIFVIAATDDVNVNEAVQQACQHWQLVNRADDQQQSDFITPAIIRRGPLLVTVSTSGASPSLSRHVKKQLDEQFDDVYEEYVYFLQHARTVIMEKLAKGSERRTALQALLAPEVLQWTREGNLVEREQFLQSLLGGTHDE